MYLKAFLFTFLLSMPAFIHAQHSIEKRDTLNAPLPTFLTKKYFHRDSLTLFQRSAPIANPFAIPKNTTEFNFDNGISKTGSISRAINIGNAQDLGVLSSFNLQLSGKLSNEIDLTAVIADDNIPVQPDGNTQQLQEFDRVFIQLNNANSKLIAGDFELKSNESYFLNYLKKGKGFLLTTNQKNYQLTFGTAIAKGKYSRYNFLGTEGSQGPYRIKGPNNELFLIIMAGTERVYIDGELLKRGELQDYTIDYNSAEITFTNKRLITAYARIIIEFEYSEKSYSRTVNVLNASFKQKNISYKINYYNEQDNKNINFLQTLSNEQKIFLSNLGDHIDQAYTSSEDSVSLNTNQILYQKIDSLGYTIYVYRPLYDGQKYKLIFTDLGPNAGNYILSNNSANGRVYEWIQPILGVPQGNYEPVVKLITPKKHEQLSIGLSFSPQKNWKISNETAISNKDLNLYATKDDQDNIGFANKTIINNLLKIYNDSIRSINLENNISIELSNKNFNAVENYRPIQFNRSYNITNTNRANDIWININSRLIKDPDNFLEYHASFYHQKNQYNALQHQITGGILNKKWKLNTNTSLLLSESTYILSSTNYLKQRANLERNLSLLTLGLSQELENNRTRLTLSDSLNNNSFAFNDFGIYIRNTNNGNQNFKIAYNHRTDQNPYLNNLSTSTNANAVSMSAEFNGNKKSVWALNYLYRKFEVTQSNTNLKNDENAIARIKHDGIIWNGVIQTATFYELGSGQEPKRAYSYIEVPIGQGLYVYKDYNRNGIKELNEFELAKFSYEANYIKVSLMSTDYISTKSTSITENILIDPSSILTNNIYLGKVVKLFSNQFTVKLDKKVAEGGDFSINPFLIKQMDTSLISFAKAIRNTFYFNRANPIFGIDYTFQQSENKNLLVNGFESRKKSEHIWQIRKIFFENYLTNIFLRFGSKGFNSYYFRERDYAISFIELKPELTYQFNSFWRLTTAASYAKQINESVLKEQAKRLSFNAEANYNAAGSYSISSKCSFIKNSYNANTNNTIAYEMLDGLQKGNNYTWSLIFQRNFTTGVQLSVIYDGRASDQAPIINIGSVQARAYF
ncbi:MAG: hypothetical protein RI934_1063 [Bacteroidota bacterium]|jgi:hypothetical protein